MRAANEAQLYTIYVPLYCCYYAIRLTYLLTPCSFCVCVCFALQLTRIPSPLSTSTRATPTSAFRALSMARCKSTFCKQRVLCTALTKRKRKKASHSKEKEKAFTSKRRGKLLFKEKKSFPKTKKACLYKKQLTNQESKQVSLQKRRRKLPC